jgi:membrane protease YdiL (CAAX protease family)
MLNPIFTNQHHSLPKQLLLFAVGWIGLTIVAFIFSLLFQTLLPFFIDISDEQTLFDFPIVLSAINFFSYLVVLLILLVLLQPYLLSLLKRFLSLEPFFKGTFLGFAVMFLGMLINFIYLSFDITIADNLNQTTIVNLVEATPIFSLLTFAFLGPIVEEITYRLGLFDYLNKKNRWLAYIITPLIFALIHFNYVAESVTNELLNLPFYVSAGLLFCWVYEKYGFATVTIAHITNNLVSFLAIIVISQQGITSS